MAFIFGFISDILLPESASSTAPEVDKLFVFITVISLIGFVGLMWTMIVFIKKYIRRTEYQKTSKLAHHNTLEAIWMIIPAIIFVGIALWGWYIYHKLDNPPPNAKIFHVIGKQWSWDFAYSYKDKTIKTHNNLYVPVDENVVLDMTSTDVVHSLFIPNFRVKKDVLPGMRTQVWFKATKPGKYPILCTEYCGTKHSKMLATVHVLRKSEFILWANKESGGAEGISFAELGKKLYAAKGCDSCHTVDGTPDIGPSLKDLWGMPREFQDGSKLEAVDAEYIRESLMEPKAKLVVGFKPKMNSFQGQLTEEEVTQLIEYIRSLGKDK